jgi:hypothetical protein
MEKTQSKSFAGARHGMCELAFSLSGLACGTVKMPKAKCTSSLRLIAFVQEFGEKYFSIDGRILLCKVCVISVMAVKRFCVRRQHCETAKHQKHLHLQSIKQNRQKLLFDNPITSTSSKTSQFHRDYVKC